MIHYHPTPTSTTDCTVGGLYSDSSEAGIFTHVNQSIDIHTPASHGPCITACGFAHARYYNKTYGSTTCHYRRACGEPVVGIPDCSGVSLCANVTYYESRDTQKWSAACTFGNGDGDIQCPKGWEHYNTSVARPGCYEGLYYSSPIPSYSGPSPEIGSRLSKN